MDQIHMKGHDLIRKILSNVLDNTQSVELQVSRPIVCRLQWFSWLQHGNIQRKLMV